MLAVLRRNPVALGLAILLHIALAVFLILEVDWRDEIKPIGADVLVVQATLVDQRELDAVENKKKDAEREKAAAAKRVEQEKLKKRRAEEKRKLAKIEKAREQRKKAEARKQQAEEKKRVELEKVRLAEVKRKKEEKKKAEEKKRKAELERKSRLEEKKRKDEEVARQKAAAEAKAKKEAEAKKKADAKKKAQAERKRKAEARARADRKAREAELAAQFAAEQDASELAQVVGLIRSKIERIWVRPEGTGELGLRCTVRVRLGGTGSVLLVNVVKSSGNGAFDRSVETAVRKADPLPMPQSKRLMAQFREIEFVFEPGI